MTDRESRKPTVTLLAATLTATLSLHAEGQKVERFGVFDAVFQAESSPRNPYTELEASAAVRRPDDSVWKTPLFWDGGRAWRLRVSPDVKGTWRYTIHSTDEGLSGRTGAFECVSSPRPGSVEAMDGYPLHFQRQDRTPFLFWGDTAWALYLDNAEERHDRDAVFRYIDKRAREGINVIHSMLLSEAGWGNAGGAPFHDLSSEEVNPAYWREVDVRIRYLNDRGIVGGLVLAWGDKQGKEPYAWRRFPSVAARKRYARYVGARYSAYSVYFIVSGEWHAEIRARKDASEDAVRAEFIEIGSALYQADAHGRMIGIHPMSSGGSVREFQAADWMGFGDYQQNYADLHRRILQSRRMRKPVVNSEYGYYLRDSSYDGEVDKHNSFGAEDMRFATWDIVMAGGYPITGYATTYMGGYRDKGPFHPDDPRNEIWAKQYHVAQSFLSRLEWWKLQPHDQWISASSTRGADREVRVRMSPTRTRKVRRPPLATYWLLAEPGKHYIAYSRGLSEEVDIRLGEEKVSGMYEGRLVDPRTGEEQRLFPATRLEARFGFKPPDTRDWVLHLSRSAAAGP